MEFLESVFLIFRIDLFDYSVKKQIFNPSKIYSIDIALNNSIAFKFSEDIGRLYENIVATELRRQGKEIFYWKDNNRAEVDIVIKEGLDIREVIQVCYHIENPETYNREIKGLLATKKQLHPERYTIISNDTKRTDIVDDIKVDIIPLWKWLLLYNAI